MPIIHKIIYRCPKCGYKIEKIRGDIAKFEDFYPPICPKCKAQMKESLIEKIKDKLCQITKEI